MKRVFGYSTLLFVTGELQTYFLHFTKCFVPSVFNSFLSSISVFWFCSFTGINSLVSMDNSGFYVNAFSEMGPLFKAISKFGSNTNHLF